MSALLHSLLFLRREILQPELRLVFFSVLLTVTAIATVGMFADRISRALVSQSNELLGADQVVYSMRAIPGQWQDKAREIGLQSTGNKEFFSVLVVGTETNLAEVKAVKSGYPLRGRLDVDIIETLEAASVPPPGTVWVEPRLLTKLRLKPGNTVQLGRTDFIISGVIRHEPDRAGSLFSLAPRVMMNHDDLEATGLIGPGSRVRHRLLLAGTREQLEQYRQWVEPLLGLNYQLRTVRDSRPEVRVSLERAERFLSLTLIVTVVLACLTIWVAMQTWVKRRMIYAAVLRTIGLTRAQILRLFIGQLLMLSLMACVLAVLLATGLQSLLVKVMQTFITGPLPGINPWVALAACLMGLMLVLAFSLPTYILFASTSPNLVLRSMPEKLDQSHWSVLWGIAALLIVLAVLVRDMQLLAITIGGLLATLLVLVLLSLLVLVLLRRIEMRLPVGIRMGVNALGRHRRETITMMTVFGLSFLFVTLLTLVRTDLIDQWRDRLPPGTPNTFVVNVAKADRLGVMQWMRDHGLENTDFYPMVKGRLVRINDREVSADSFESERTKRLVKREFNLSWSDRRPAHNPLVAGSWWVDDTLPQWSVERGIADRLGIKMGDTLTYDVTGKRVKGRVSSIREVQWDSFKVNFFVLGQASMLQAYPTKYISSFYLSPDKEPLMGDLVSRFPSITILDTDAIMQRIRRVIDKVSYAAEAAFGFTLLAAVLLVMGMIQAGRRLRQHETALLRTMGATSGILSVAQLTEFLIMGAGSGLLAILAANGLAWVVATQLLDFEFEVNFMLAGIIMMAGMLLAVVTGWLILKSQQRLSPLILLGRG